MRPKPHIKHSHARSLLFRTYVVQNDRFKVHPVVLPLLHIDAHDAGGLFVAVSFGRRRTERNDVSSS